MPGPILTLLWPIMVVVAWIMVAFHAGLTALGLGTDSGGAWIGSIVGLVIVMRIVLIPLFVKQIKASRGLQLIQPQMQKLQAKYKGKTDPASRQAMQQEMMALYREAGTNPFASCLPILAQSPIFFALFQVLIALPALAAGTYADGARDSIGPLTQELAASAESSTLFGAPLSATFMKAAEYGDAAMNVRVVTVILIVLMSVTTFTTQRQLTMKNMPAAALDNPMARQQRMLMYILPLIFAVSGINFPIGVLIYWFTTNLWSMGQQFYVIRRMPAPGSEAEAALKARKAKRASRHGTPVAIEDAPADTEAKPVSGQRVQPVRKDRQRSTRPAQGGAAAGAASGSGSGSPASSSKPTGQASGGQGSRAQGSGSQGSGAKSGSGTQRPSGQGSSGQGSGAKQQRPQGQGQRTTASGQRTARPRPAGQSGSGTTSGGATGSGSTKASGAAGGSAGTSKPSDSAGPQDG